MVGEPITEPHLLTANPDRGHEQHRRPLRRGHRPGRSRIPGSDLVIGKAGKTGKTGMTTLIKRTSRYTVPVALPADRRATTCDALITTVSAMPTTLVETLT